MRAPLLLALALAPALAGCAGGPLQWAGVAEAWQYEEGAIVEVQLHRGRAGGAASGETAVAGMGQVSAIEDAVAEVLTRDEGWRNVTLEGWTFDRVNSTASAPLPLTGFDGFRLRATFILRDASRLTTDELASWREQYRRPYHAEVELATRGANSTLRFALYALDEGARDLLLPPSSEATLRPVNVTGAPSWQLRVTGENGTEFLDTTPPSVAPRGLTLTLPYAGIARVDAEYLLALADGRVLSHRDVDDDAWPATYAQQKRLEQRN